MQIDTPEKQQPTARRRRLRLGAAPAIAMIAIVVLAGCGSSAKSTTNSASTKASTSQSGSRSNRFAALRECLKKEGITLPARPSGGQSGGGGVPGAGGGFKLPEGVSRTKLQEAFKKCGGGFGFGGGARRGFNSAKVRAALASYAACMRENGVNLPAPNTSGNGPVFNTKGINTSSASFKSAQRKCRSKLPGRFGGARPPGSGAGGPPAGGEGGAPPGGEAGAPAGPPAGEAPTNG